LLTNQIAAVVVVLGFTQLVEPIARMILAMFESTAEVAKFLPGAVSEALANGGNGATTTTLVWWQGALMMLLYAAVLAVLGRTTTLRKDIS
jgi:hypothetical protein